MQAAAWGPACHFLNAISIPAMKTRLTLTNYLLTGLVLVTTASAQNSDRGAAMVEDRGLPTGNLPPTGSIPDETGSALGGARAVPIDPGFVQARDLPEQPAVSVPDLNLLQIVAGSEKHTTFVSALRAAGLEDQLLVNGPFTVLCPTNEAFQTLVPGVLEKWMLPENRQTLRQVLLYHFIPGRILSTGITPGGVRTVQGQEVTFIGGAQGVFTVQGASIQQADILANNGVIHSIDRVLVPPTVNLLKDASGTGR
jgi:uncharacterized surface protein with fasciclin (FAS1) repeats